MSTSPAGDAPQQNPVARQGAAAAGYNCRSRPRRCSHSTARALDALTDLTLRPRQALAKFEKISRRWKPIDRDFVFWVGGGLRLRKQEDALEETSLARFADDGGRA